MPSQVIVTTAEAQLFSSSLSADVFHLVQQFSHCYFHLILFELEVNLFGLLSPYTLTVPAHYKSSNEWNVKDMGVPKRRSRCCVINIYVGHPKMYQQYSSNPVQRHVRNLENLFRVFQRYIAVLADTHYLSRFNSTGLISTSPFNLWHFHPTSYGSIVFAFHYSNSTCACGEYEPRDCCPGEISTVHDVTSAWLLCSYCAKTLYKFRCHGILQCMKAMTEAHDKVTAGGSDVYWNTELTERSATGNNTAAGGPLFDHGKRNVKPTEFLKFFVLGQINNSFVLPFKISNVDDQVDRLPAVAWSESLDRLTVILEDDSDFHTTESILLETSKSPAARLLFITADKVEPVKSKVNLYFIPMQKTVWFWTFAAIFGAAVMLLLVFMWDTTASSMDKGIFVTSLANFPPVSFWIFGVLLEQVGKYVMSSSDERSLSPLRRRILRVTVLTILYPALVLTNGYRGLLNANYMTLSQYRTSWETIAELENFTLYFALDERSYAHFGKLLNDKDDPWRSVSEFAAPCGDEFYTQFNGAFCAFSQGIVDLSSSIIKSHAECHEVLEEVENNESQNGGNGSHMGSDGDGWHCNSAARDLRLYLRLYRSYSILSKAAIAETVTNNLSEPHTAFAISEEYLPTVWRHFRKAMKNDRRLKFAINYNSPHDLTFMVHRSKLVVGSGLEKRFTERVTKRVGVMLSSGLWEEQLRLQYTRIEDSKLELDSYTVGPLSLHHDVVHLIFVILGILLLTVITVFATELGIEQVMGCIEIY